MGMFSKSSVTLKWTVLWSFLLLHLFSQKDLLKKCHSAKASYLFQQDKFYDVSYDTGDKSIQCSRRPDAFKFWMTWKALGTVGLEERVNRALALSRYVCVSKSMHVCKRPNENSICKVCTHSFICAFLLSSDNQFFSIYIVVCVRKYDKAVLSWPSRILAE